MDSSEKDSDGFTLVGRCPAQDKCLIGPLMYDSGYDWEKPCPYYEGADMAEGILHIYCSIGPEETTPVCPSCRDPQLFRKKNSFFPLWLCKSCHFYAIPPAIDTEIPRHGFAFPVRCDCGKRGWVIPSHPDMPTHRMTWTCPVCGYENIVTDIIDPN